MVIILWGDYLRIPWIGLPVLIMNHDAALLIYSKK